MKPQNIWAIAILIRSALAFTFMALVTGYLFGAPTWAWVGFALLYSYQSEILGELRKTK